MKIRLLFAGIAVLSQTVLCAAEVELFPGGILDLPVAQGAGGFTVAYDGAELWTWIEPSAGGTKGYLVLGNYVLSVLRDNASGDFGPAESIAFWGRTGDAVTGVSYLLATSDTSVPTLSRLPATISRSVPFSITATSAGPKLSLVPEPHTVWLLLPGLAWLVKRR